MKRIMGVLVAALLLAVPVHAELAPGTTIEDYLPTIYDGTIEAGGVLFSFTDLDEFEIEDTKYKLKASMEYDTGNGIITLKELEFDPDPVVDATQLVYNNTGSDQTYQFYIDQPAYLATASSSVRGAVVVTLLDKSAFPFDGSSFSDNGTPVYKAYIDGNEVDTLMDPYSLVTIPNNTTADDSEEFGWSTYGAGVASSIGIQIEFTLSAGDQATVQSRFEVIPEPSSMILIGIASSTILFIRRKFLV